MTQVNGRLTIEDPHTDTVLYDEEYGYDLADAEDVPVDIGCAVVESINRVVRGALPGGTSGELEVRLVFNAAA